MKRTRYSKKKLHSKRSSTAPGNSKRHSNSRKRTRIQKKANQVKNKTKTVSWESQNMEIKIVIMQFMINQIVDDLQQKGIYTEKEVKNLYSKTYQFWKNDLQGLGDPFAALDLSATKKALLQDPFPSQKLSDSFHSSGKAKWSEYLARYKEEMKALKRQLMMQKLQHIKDQTKTFD